jgi:hypothetical protein
MSDDEMNARDEEIQDKLDAKQPQGVDADVIAYQRLYEALGKSNARLPTSFAYNVMVRVARARLSARDSRMSVASVLLGALALALGTGALLAMSALGYTTVVDWPSIKQILHVPVAWVYAAAGLLLVALLDTAVGLYRHR